MTIIVNAEGDDDASKLLDERNKEGISKNCTPFTKCISNTNNTQIDYAKDIDVVMSMHNLIEYTQNYSKISGSFW